MRNITSHQVNRCNEAIFIEVQDEPGHGGASHAYWIGWHDGNDSNDGGSISLNFQNGPIADVGVNGITNEALLAVLIDRMEGFQSGQYATIENQIALDHLRAAAEMLRFRTQQRERRGVEGTHAV